MSRVSWIEAVQVNKPLASACSVAEELKGYAVKKKCLPIQR